MDPRRAERVSEALREELEEIIAYELEDPRIQAADVVEVLISPDARNAHIRIRTEGDAEAQADTVTALEHARHFLRRELSRRIDIFRIPELHFELAVAPQLDQRAARLLRRMRRGRARDTEGAAAEGRTE
jgi:ribosome-binding factor A